MAESEAVSSFGTRLQMGAGDGPPETFADIAEVRDITPPEISADTDEVTHQLSPQAWKEHIATLLSAGDVTFEVNWLPADPTHNATDGILAAIVARTKVNFHIVFPDPGATVWAFAAIPLSFQGSGAVNGVMRGNITLRPTGPMDFDWAP